MPGYKMKDKKKMKMGTQMYGGGGKVTRDSVLMQLGGGLSTAAINAMSKLTHLKMKHYKNKKIK
jgi:hypothetical protein